MKIKVYKNNEYQNGKAGEEGEKIKINVESNDLASCCYTVTYGTLVLISMDDEEPEETDV